MKQSHRHHYIPQFLIRNFAADDGMLYVYNKRENKISRQSPKSIFFELDRNSIDFSGVELDMLEKLYSELDSRIALDLKNALNSLKGNKGITPEEIVSIITLASLLKWRVPLSDKQFDALKEDTTQEDLAIKITIKDKNTSPDPAAISFIENSEVFKETKRVLLSFLPLQDGKKLMDFHNNSFIMTNEKFPALIGDSPIIEKTNSDFRKMEDFIFPLSSEATFIYHSGGHKGIINGTFYFQRDLATLHLSKKYVACKSRHHLENIIKIYAELKKDNKTDVITKHVFHFVQ